MKGNYYYVAGNMKPRLIKMKVVVIATLLIFCFSCDKDQDTKQDVAGTYQLSGIKITILYPVWPPTMGEQPKIDTVPFSLKFRIEKPAGKQDSLRFYGLESANVVYEEGPNCINYYCGVYARYVNDSLQFNLTAPGGSYKGTGFIKGDSIELNTKYNYRPTTYHYILKGKKQ